MHCLTIFKSMHFIIREVHTISVIWNTATLKASINITEYQGIK